MLPLLLVLFSLPYPTMALEDEYGLLQSIRFSPGVNLIFTAYGTYISLGVAAISFLFI